MKLVQYKIKEVTNHATILLISLRVINLNENKTELANLFQQFHHVCQQVQYSIMLSTAVLMQSSYFLSSVLLKFVSQIVTCLTSLCEVYVVTTQPAWLCWLVRCLMFVGMSIVWNYNELFFLKTQRVSAFCQFPPEILNNVIS